MFTKVTGTWRCSNRATANGSVFSSCPSPTPKPTPLVDSTDVAMVKVQVTTKHCEITQFGPPLRSHADEELFKNITTNNQHVLHRFLPLPSHASQNYNLRPRSHNFELPGRINHLTDCNFLTQMHTQTFTSNSENLGHIQSSI